MEIKYLTLNPGEYGPQEQKIVDAINAFLSGTPEELTRRAAEKDRGLGNMELNSGMTPVDTVLGTNDLLYYAYRTNPRNPLYTDPNYWKTTKQYQGFPAAPMCVEMGSTFPYIPKGDAASPLINTEAFTPRGLDHELWFYAPIYAGDHVESKLTSQSCTDITVPGTDIRKFRVEGTNDLYNEDGTLLMHGHYRAVETYKVFADAAMMQDYPGDKAIRMATHCDWDHMRPRHVYTEEDYQNIVTLWKNEEIRGSSPRYWEDVQIGDEPVPICDGPYTEADRWNGGNAIRVQRPETPRDIMQPDPHRKPDPMMPPGPPAKLETDAFGVRTIQQGHPGGMPIPGGPGPKHPNQRSTFMNTQGRDYFARLVTNWCGDDGWLLMLAWRLEFCMDCQDGGHNVFPADFDRPSYLLKVPYLRQQGRFMNDHGMVGDVAITKGYVCDKSIDENGRHIVDLVLWCETLEGGIFAEGYAKVVLPTKEG